MKGQQRVIHILGIDFEKTVTEKKIARTWKQPKCPSSDEWIKKLWYMYTMEYYSAIKRNTFDSVLTRWMNLQHIIQSEVSQKKTNITY